MDASRRQPGVSRLRRKQPVSPSCGPFESRVCPVFVPAANLTQHPLYEDTCYGEALALQCCGRALAGLGEALQACTLADRRQRVCSSGAHLSQLVQELVCRRCMCAPAGANALQATLAALCSSLEASAMTPWWGSPPGAYPSPTPPASHGAPLGSDWVPTVLPAAAQVAAPALRLVPTGRCMPAHCARNAGTVQPGAACLLTASCQCSCRYPSVFTDVAFMRGWIDANVQVQGSADWGEHRGVLSS